MGRKSNKPIYRRNKPTVNLDKITDTSGTSKANKPDSCEQSEYGEATKVSIDYDGGKSKVGEIPYKIIISLIGAIFVLGSIIWYFARLDTHVHYIKNELKTVKKKTEKLSESSISQDVRIKNIDNNINEICYEVRELNNKMFENSKNK